jgi:uroporphyrinogen decarboxylase
MIKFNEIVLNSPSRLAMPIATYPALALTKASVRDIVTRADAQFEAQRALHLRYGTPFVLSAMDLSLEAQAFGCEVMMSDSEIPTVTGRLVTTLEQAQRLAVPKPGDGRSGVPLEAVARLRAMPSAPIVLGGCIGPFSLAARMTGVSEAMELTVTEPELLHTRLEKATAFLSAYVAAFREAGAGGVIMAEPAAGLLSPRGLAQFSSAYIRRIGTEHDRADFSIILHNCAAKLLHLPAILETGLSAFHFGAPMDIVAALEKVSEQIVLCGNLDPTAAFVQSTPDELTASVSRLLAATAARKNFVISSGCDVPPNASIINLDAFNAAVGLPPRDPAV